MSKHFKKEIHPMKNKKQQKPPPHKDNIKTFRVLRNTGGVPTRYTACVLSALGRHSAYLVCLHLETSSRSGSS